jgi:hypothetical protein
MTQTHINAQTKGPVVGQGVDIWAKDNPDKPCRAIASIAGPNRVDLIPEREANRRLFAAGFTMLDKAGRTLGVDAAELGESIDLAALIRTARKALKLMEKSDLAEHHCQCPLDVEGPIGSKGCVCVDPLAPLRAQLAKLPKPANA